MTDSLTGFDVILGNPPWVSYTGRQKAEVSDRFLAVLEGRHPCIARWPALHPAMMVLSIQLLNRRGRAGLVLPKQVADLAAYELARSEVTAKAPLTMPVVDVGEDAFPGVTQPVGLFTWAVTGGAVASTAPWEMGRPATPASGPDTAVSPASSHHDLIRDLAAALKSRPRFPDKTFSDPGVHTGNVSKKIILSDRRDDGGQYVPVREGKDISAYFCGPPRKWLWLDPDLVESEYCTVRDAHRYTDVPILLRQTANRPIAARHANPTYFRNSMLACHGQPGVPDVVVVAFLNSALYGLLHRAAMLDANQKAFPQVKVRHLHALPAVPADSLQQAAGDRRLQDSLEQAVAVAEAAANTDGNLSNELLEPIERLVLVAFGLEPTLASTLLEAVQ